MKPLKSYLAWVAVTLAVAGATTACQDDIDDPIIDAPVAKDQPNTSILELKTKYWNDATNYIDTIGTRDDGSHYVISGRVVSSDEAGNVFKSLVIQDGTAALSLSINSYNLYLKYRRGQEIVLDVTGMYIGKYNGLIQLGQPEWYENGGAWEASFMSPEYFMAHAQLNGFPDTSKLDTLVVNSFSELPTDPAGLIKWQSQLVRFNNVSFANGGKATFSEHKSNVNQSLVDAEGSSINVRTSGYSNFWNKTLPEGHGDVVAILSYYGTSGWQLILNDYEGCMNFGNPTVPEGSQSKPWSVDKAIEIEKAGTEKSGWVSGYIVGAVGPEVTEVKSNDDIEWKADPLLSNTLVIGQTADTKDIAHALVIELPDGSKLQTLGNLVDNPGNYGKQIALRGTLAKAMGTFGITGNNGTTNEFSIEGLNPGGEGIPEGTGVKESPYNCAQVIAGVSGNAWVKGYIVGSSAGKTAAEMTNATGAAAATSNIFIAAKADETDYSKCVPIQLPIGEIRTALNINANPGNLGKVVAVKGSLEKYFGQPGVKTVTEFDLEGGVTPPTPPTTSGDFKGDFNSFNNGQPLSKYGTYTNNTGWTATNAIILGGGENDANPIFKFIGAAGTLAPTLNGKTSAPGSLVSPALTGSIKTLTFKYGFAFNDSKCQFTVNVKDAAGNVIKSEVVTLDKIEKAKAYDFSLDVNYNGNFTIEIINNCYSQIADKNKDRVSIWNLTWTE